MRVSNRQNLNSFSLNKQSRNLTTNHQARLEPDKSESNLLTQNSELNNSNISKTLAQDFDNNQTYTLIQQNDNYMNKYSPIPIGC